MWIKIRLNHSISNDSENGTRREKEKNLNDNLDRTQIEKAFVVDGTS